jgi:SAM-dependent methyltransferase
MRRDCWCGNRDLKPFSPDYRLCRACGTLVSLAELANEGYLVRDDDTDFYGKQYWLGHQAEELGLPQIEERSRLDLPERCIHWLRHVLRYRLPPARVLELGSAHGGFVALMRWAGYDAVGLEMSPWVADLARRTFQVPMLVGPIEKQDLAPGSFDVIVANDVMEHLPDPLTTLRQAVQLLKPDGVLAIQMPEYPDGVSLDDLQARNDRFLLHLRKEEHLYLYSKRSARLLYQRLGLEHVQFQSPMFDYDMYFFASRVLLQPLSPEDVGRHLQATPMGRLLLALLDKDDEAQQLTQRWQSSEDDRAARLRVIQDMSVKLAMSETDRAARLEALNELGRQLQGLQHRLVVSDADRLARLKAIGELEKQLAVSEADRAERLQAMNKLERLLAASEADRTERLRTITELSRNLIIADEDRNARLRIISTQERMLQEQQATIAAQQKALAFLRATCLVSDRPPLWQRVPHKLARLLLPEKWRRTLRRHLLPPSPASAAVAPVAGALNAADVSRSAT